MTTTSFESSTLGLAVGIPIALVLALVGVSVAAWLWSRRERPVRGGDAELREKEHAYGDVADVQASAYDAPESKLVV